MALCWTPDIAVGIPTLDAQHQELFSRADGLLVACSQCRGHEYVGTALRFLERYIVEHFGHEHALMVRHNYPRIEAHDAQHEAFTRRFTELKWKIRIDGPSPDIVTMTNRLMLGWFTGHIRSVDAALGRFLRATQGP